MNRSTIRVISRALLLATLGVGVSTQLGGGCVSDDGGYDGDTSSGSSGGSSGGNADRPGYDDNDRIPRRADLVKEGRDTLRHRVDADGRVYLYDADDRRVLGSYPIRTGREFIVSPKDDRAWIDDDRVLDYDFNRDHTLRIYFLNDRNNDSGNSGGRLPSELRDADRVAKGRGDISYSARNGGKVWVFDRTDSRIVYQSDLRKQDRILVSPAENYISLDTAGRSRASYRLDPKHDYEIYFKRDSRVDQVAGPENPRPEKPQPSKPEPAKPAPPGPVFGGMGAGATVPKSAIIAREGKGQDLSFSADGIGTVYVYDADAGMTIATYNIKKGQRFTLSPGTGEAAVDGKVVFKKSLSVKKNYKLYFNLNV